MSAMGQKRTLASCAHHALGQASKSRSGCAEVFGCLVTSVCFFEHTPGPLAIRPMLLKRHRVPLASFSGEKIATIDVYGARKLIDRIDNGMDDVSAQRLSVHRAQGLRASCLDFVWRSFHAPPKHIVLPARVNTDDGPHSMIVGHDHHSWRPNHFDDGERIRMKEFLDFSALGLSQSFEDCRLIGHRASEHHTDCFESRILRKRRSAVSNKPFCLKHQDLHRSKRRRMSLTSRLLLLDVTENGPCASLQRVVCPLWVISGHFAVQSPCPLYPRKRTFGSAITDVC